MAAAAAAPSQTLCRSALLQKCITSRDAASNDQKREQETTQNQRNRRATVVGQPLARIHGATTR